jgi:TRAP transporter 4TM/12TM fusion protein
MLSFARAHALYADLLRGGLLLSVVGWIMDVPGRMGWALYTEQFLALAAGLSAALVLLSPGRAASQRQQLLSWGMSVVCLAAFGYVSVHYPNLQLSLVDAQWPAVLLALVILACVLEATRRRSGLALPIMLLALVAFAFWVGPHLPDSFKTRPVSFARLSMYLALDTNALFSSILYIATVVVTPFILFGGLLNAFGGGQLFSILADRAVGHYRGGPAKASVVGSAAFGMISGSAVANVVTTGSVSIPLMARSGFGPRLAGAIEAIASTGGQLMPPILGAAAFLMAELLELPYRDIALAAVFPAFLFYAVLFLAVDLEARRLERSGVDSKAMAERLIASRQEVIGWRWRFLLPVGVLLYLLFWEKRTAEMSGILASASLVVVFLLAPGAALLRRLFECLKATLRAMDGVAEIVMLSAAAGLVIGVLNLTGISFAITMQIFELSGGSLALLLLFSALLSLLLGMGLPTVGVYILLATLVAPAMTKLGVLPLAAHFFVMFFGMLSMITPPVAIASFAAASIAGHSPWATSMTTLRLAMGLYLIPVAFVLNPVLLTWSDPVAGITAALPTLVAVMALTLACGGQPHSLPRRLIWALIAAMAFWASLPSVMHDAGRVGVGLVGIVVLAWTFFARDGMGKVSLVNQPH